MWTFEAPCYMRTHTMRGNVNQGQRGTHVQPSLILYGLLSSAPVSTAHVMVGLQATSDNSEGALQYLQESWSA